MKCPFCGGKHLQTVTETNTTASTSGGGYSGAKGCLGYLLFGPFGLLCGNCGSSQKTTVSSNTSTFWVCSDCGNKFRDLQEQRDEIAALNQTIKNSVSGIIVATICLVILFAICYSFGINEIDALLIFYGVVIILGALSIPVLMGKVKKKQSDYEELEKKVMD